MSDQNITQAPKCQIYPVDYAVWAFQPFGPADNVRGMFMFLGHHYRGFPVIKVGEEAHDAIIAGHPVEFTHKGVSYVFVEGKAHEKPNVRVEIEDGVRTYYVMPRSVPTE